LHNCLQQYGKHDNTIGIPTYFADGFAALLSFLVFGRAQSIGADMDVKGPGGSSNVRGASDVEGVSTGGGVERWDRGDAALGHSSTRLLGIRMGLSGWYTKGGRSGTGIGGVGGGGGEVICASKGGEVICMGSSAIAEMVAMLDCKMPALCS
jgi:hypothetical protein